MKNNSKSGTRRTTRTEKSSRNPVARSATQVAVAPDRMTVKLRYADQVTLSTTSLGYASYFMRLNSVYDPDFSSTGHQPTGYDEWAAFYNYYRVLSVSGRLSIMDGSSAASSSTVFSIKPTQSTTGSTSVAEILEDQRAQGCGYNPTGPAEHLSFSYDIRALFGVSKEFYAQANYAALTSANPYDQVFLEIQARSAGTGSTYFVLMQLEYIVEFFERLEVAPSLLSKAMTFIKEEEERAKNPKPTQSTFSIRR